jgi:3-phenylpropionate/trans-cinnamate dioxygenase ferredoxin reductase subunit
MSDVQDHYDYVLVGAGMAAASALTGIRAVDASGTVAMFGAEPDPPLYRPDLSKTLWLKDGATPEGSTLVEEGADVDLRTRVEVSTINPDEHTVALADGTTVRYGRLLLATGAQPRTVGLPAGPRVVYYRTAADYRTLRDLARPGAHVIVVGGGYIGSEIAAALSQNDVRVTLVLAGALVQEAMFPEGLARHVTDAFTAHGVEIVHGLLAGGEATDDGVSLRLEDGTELSGDAAVIGVGVTPRTGLAERAGLTVDDGVVVDERLRTSAEDVYAAGDVASYPDVRLGRRRVEHADNAEKMGEAAGRVMAGADAAYDRTPFFWSDLYDDGYEAIGELSTRHTVVEDWKDDGHGAGVVYYLDGGAVRGVLLWNVWDSVPRARELIESSATTPISDPGSLIGRIPLG